jgi:hypothetical protein
VTGVREQKEALLNLDLQYKIYITMKSIFFGGAYFVLSLDLIYPLTDFSLPLSPSLIHLKARDSIQ